MNFSTAKHLAVISGVFALVVAMLLLANDTGSAVLVESDELRALKAELAKVPGDEDLKEKIRTLDLQLRQDFFERHAFSSTGTWLLLGGGVVLLVALRSASASREQPPKPGPRTDEAGEMAEVASWSRWSVAAIASVLGGAAFGLMSRPGPALTPDALAAARQTNSVAAVVPTWPSAEELQKNWHRFRGPGGLGRSAFANVPRQWNGKAGKGIRWKTEVPLPGHSSPIFWKDRVFLTGADKGRREVFCFDADTGSLLWRKPVMTIASSQAKPPEIMEDTGYAASTPVTDGKRVAAIFANGDIAAFDLDGQRVWIHNLGLPDNPYGYSSSLALWHDKVIVQYDQNKKTPSRLLALDFATGDTAWETPNEFGATWSSPTVISTGKGDQIITTSAPWVVGYAAETGKEIWRAKCLDGDVAPSPVYSNGLVFVTNAYAQLAAIRPDGQGDVTETHIAWTADEGLPDTCSPLCAGKWLYLLEPGLLYCFDAAAGTKVWEQDITGNFTASPSLAGDRIYMLNNEGEMIQIKTGDKYEEIGRASLGEACHATPAFADGRIYIRGVKHLYCIGE